MKKVGLFFGTFNPIHVGHLVIANYMADYTDLDEVWLVVTPQNPFKEKQSLLNDIHRLTLVRVATEDNVKLKVSNIEFDLPKPSFTCDTLAHLSEKHPNNKFVLIMGEDNLRTFHKWKNYEYIINHHELYVYPRVIEKHEKELARAEILSHSNLKKIDEVPIMQISASFIRDGIKNKKDVRYLLTEKVYQYIDEMNFYR